MSTVFNVRVIVYKSEFTFYAYWSLGCYVFDVTIFRLEYSSNLFGRFKYNRSLLAGLPDVALFSTLSSKTCLVSLMALEEVGTYAEQHFRV